MRPLVPEDLYRNGARAAAARRERTGNFFRAVTLACRAAYAAEPQRAVKDLMRGDEQVQKTWNVINRAASAPATIGTTGWAAEFGQTLIVDLLTLMSPISAGAAVLDAGLNLSFDRHAHISIPDFVASSANAGWIADSAPIPVKQFAVDAPNKLELHKLAAIVVYSREMAEAGNFETIVRDNIIRSLALALDAALFDSTAADTTRPAGLRNGKTALTASTSTDGQSAYGNDIAALADAVSVVASNDALVYIASPGRRRHMQVRWFVETPDRLLSSNAIAPADILCIAPIALASAVDDAPRVEIDKASTIHVADPASDLVSTPGAVSSPMRSLFQTDALALKVVLPVSWTLRHPNGIAWLTATGW
jgi:Phage capsid family